jgi:hypothetical protein
MFDPPLSRDAFGHIDDPRAWEILVTRALEKAGRDSRRLMEEARVDPDLMNKPVTI